jgi:hypothetical protein
MIGEATSCRGGEGLGLLRTASSRFGGGQTGLCACRAGKSAQVAGDPVQPHTYTYMPDIGKGLLVLGEREEALGRA